MINPEPCKEKRRRPQLFLVGIVPCIYPGFEHVAQMGLEHLDGAINELQAHFSSTAAHQQRALGNCKLDISAETKHPAGVRQQGAASLYLSRVGGKCFYRVFPARHGALLVQTSLNVLANLQQSRRKKCPA